MVMKRKIKKLNGEQLNEGLLYKLSLFYRQNKIFIFYYYLNKQLF